LGIRTGACAEAAPASGVVTTNDASRQVTAKSDNGPRSARWIDALRFPPSARTMGYFNLSEVNASKAGLERQEKSGVMQKT
jgi:hypothetical protein